MPVVLWVSCKYYRDALRGSATTTARVQMYVVILTYVAELSEIDAAAADHGTRLDQNYADGVSLSSGRQEPRVGGVILAGHVDRAELARRLALDPFQQRGLATAQVVEFVPSRAVEGLHALLD